ncbi:MAG TPA: metal-dependent hydrolase, partial [Pyrinomonadaceae bacterium]|nr:metal-dependent hydrolase [Pyrinomonadaceae bacterium]
SSFRRTHFDRRYREAGGIGDHAAGGSIMPTIFSHAIFASAIGGAFRAGHSQRLPARFWILTALCAILPDFDVIGFAFRVEYGSILGHRGISHSILFSLLTGAVVSLIFFSGFQIPKWKMGLYFAAITFTHPLLDMFTDGGLGVALLAPFSSERFFFPWRPVEVSPIGAGFFSERGLTVIASEALWIILPSILIVIASSLFRRISLRDSR